jgi:gluconokinase
MGVVGAGKTTVGILLAQRLGWKFRDADDFHPAQNIEKIRRGFDLTDQDRVPWIEALHSAIQQWNAAGENVVLACSALKRSYREQLRVGPVRFVYLKGSHELILNRLQARRGHFASASILDGQFADLEEPKDATPVDIDKSPDAIVSEILEKLGKLLPAST